MSIVEEGVQLLQGTTYAVEHSVHGVNDSTAPPITIYPIHMQLSGSRGRPKVIVNVELVDLSRGCGYTWNEIADAMQMNRMEL